MRTRRLDRCERCALPEPVCLCALPRVAVKTRVHVLVHHIEAFKTTNTGRLAQLALGAGYERWGRPHQPVPTLPEGPILLLFPFDDARELVPSDAGTLVVPDGNWPQARKIARRVSTQPHVTRVKLADHESRYHLRHTRREGAVSTFESIAHALAILEGPEVASACLAMFDTFVARHTRFASGAIHAPKSVESNVSTAEPACVGDESSRSRGSKATETE